MHSPDPLPKHFLAVVLFGAILDVAFCLLFQRENSSYEKVAARKPTALDGTPLTFPENAIPPKSEKRRRLF